MDLEAASVLFITPYFCASGFFLYTAALPVDLTLTQKQQQFLHRNICLAPQWWDLTHRPFFNLI
jgi:hypothetical protein